MYMYNVKNYVLVHVQCKTIMYLYIILFTLFEILVLSAYEGHVFRK